VFWNQVYFALPNLSMIHSHDPGDYFKIGIRDLKYLVILVWTFRYISN